MKKTQRELLEDIQVAIDLTNDPIDLNDDEVLTRKNLINKGIRRWGSDNVTRWNELYNNSLLESPIEPRKTDYKLPGDYYLLDAVYDESGSPIEVRSIRHATSIDRYVYVEGNTRDGYILKLGWVPEDDDKLIGQKLRVLHYRHPKELDNEDDIPEMSNPDFLVAFVSSEVSIDDDLNKYTKFMNDAQNYLANMRSVNNQIAQNQQDKVQDDDNLAFGA